MRVNLLAAAALGLFAALFFSGCGSTSYADSVGPAVRHMARVIRTFDATRTSDISSVGAACRAAMHALRSDTALADQPPPAEYAQLGNALRQAYRHATAGFSDCADGAARDDYIRMVRADTEIAVSNRWIRITQSLDR